MTLRGVTMNIKGVTMKIRGPSRNIRGFIISFLGGGLFNFIEITYFAHRTNLCYNLMVWPLKGLKYMTENCNILFAKKGPVVPWINMFEKLWYLFVSKFSILVSFNMLTKVYKFSNHGKPGREIYNYDMFLRPRPRCFEGVVWSNHIQWKVSFQKSWEPV